MAVLVTTLCCLSNEKEFLYQLLIIIAKHASMLIKITEHKIFQMIKSDSIKFLPSCLFFLNQKSPPLLIFPTTFIIIDKDVLWNIFTEIVFCNETYQVTSSFLHLFSEREKSSCGLEASGRDWHVLKGHLLKSRYLLAKTQTSQLQTLSS